MYESHVVNLHEHYDSTFQVFFPPLIILTFADLIIYFFVVEERIQRSLGE